MQNQIEKFIEDIINNPKRSLLVSLFLFLATAPGILFIKQDFSYRVWYSESDPLLQRYDKFERKFGNDDNLIIGIYNKDGLYNKNSLTKIFNLTEEVWKVASISRVDSLANFDYIESKEDDIEINPLIAQDSLSSINDKFIEDLKTKINNHKHIKENYISRDGKLALIVAQISPSYTALADNELITTQARELVEKYTDENHKLQLIGTSVLTHIFKEITQQDVGKLLPMLYLIFSILLWIIYRRKSGILIPYLIITVSISMMLGVSSYLGLKINTLSAVAPNILLTVAIADSIHILTVYFFCLKQGFTNSDAVRYSLTKNFLPTLLTSITTAIGFFSFSSAKIEPISGMGISVGFGVIFAWLATYMLIGPIISLMSAKNISNNRPNTNIIVKDKTKRLIANIFKYRFIILIFTIISIISSSYIAIKNLQVNLDPYTQFPANYKFVEDIKTIEKHMGPTDNIDFMIKASGIDSAKDPIFLKKVEIYQNWLLEQDYIDSTFSIIDILKDINKTLNNNKEKFYVIPNDKETIGQELLFYSMGLPPGKELTNQISLKQDYVHVSANWSVINSKEAKEKMVLMQNKAHKLKLNSVITGKMPLFHELTPYVVKSFTDSFIMALIFITIILIIVLKSFKLGLLALVPNLFPLIIGSLFYTIFGWYIDMASVIIASVCLGIAVDDSIHFLFEYKKYKLKGLSPIESLEIIFTNTVPSLVNTTILLVIGFGSFYIADYVPNSNFGVMVAIVLTVALLADLIILPAILLISEKRVHNE